MNPYCLSNYKTPDGQTSHVLDTIHCCGRSAGQYLAAEEAHQKALRSAAQWAATHPNYEHTSHSLRQWTGKLLVRAGNRLQGAAPKTKTEIQPATH
jgi:hypothetical protein